MFEILQPSLEEWIDTDDLSASLGAFLESCEHTRMIGSRILTDNQDAIEGGS